MLIADSLPPQPRKVYKTPARSGGTESSHSAFLTHLTEVQPGHDPTSRLGAGRGQPMVGVIINKARDVGRAGFG